MYFANFKYANSNIRNVLFHNYCGSQVLHIFNSCMDEIYIVWRVAICRVWRVPWTTLCKLLPNLANCMAIESWFSTRLIKMAMNLSNIFIKTHLVCAKKNIIYDYYIKQMNLFTSLQ